ncbi:MAG: L,D-transpeptidase family protein [Candidatus Moranbacteria bacterium]|nr:L,D-transpeptidase family protein [Candidatus Moranbacteria bacterium]
MSPQTFKRLSLFAAVMAGLVPAAFIVFGSAHVFGTVRAEAVGDGPKTPQDAFVIGFSEPIVGDGLDGKISIYPEKPFRMLWNDDRTNVSILPDGRWDSDGQYRVTIDQSKSGIAKTVPTSSFSFRVPDYPGISSVTPGDGTSGVVLDIEDPIVVRFDRSVKDFYVDFRISPRVEVTYENDADKTEFRILPKGDVQPGTKYTVSILAKWRGESDGAYKELGSTSFSTLPEKPVEWAKDIAERVSQAKRFTHASKPAGKYIDINLESQVMILFQDGLALDAYPISSGKRGMETPKGEFAVRNKAARPWSKAYGLYMPNWMALVPDGKFGIHELPEWPGGYKEGANHLGVPVSHGCVRLGVGPAKRVFDWAEIGTPVIIR